jgi:hypothetical protein
MLVIIKLVNSTISEMRKYLPIVIVLVVYLLLVERFFEYFPNGWDQTESAWAIQQDFLPHSPYILYFIIGKIFYLIIQDPAIALSTISALCGTFALSFYYFSLKEFLFINPSQEIPILKPAWIAGLAALFLGTNYLFIRQASTQEPYTAQVFFIFLSLWLMLRPTYIRILLSGLTFGCAFAVHNSSLFIIPAFLYLAFSLSRQMKIRRGLVTWILAVGAVASVFFAIMYVLLPFKAGTNQLINTLIYARGLGPGISLHWLSDLTFLKKSAGALLERLFSMDVPHIRRPPPSLPTGFVWFTGILGMIGAIFTWLRNRLIAIFWLLYCLPYMVYEIAAGGTPDSGVYLVFFLPALISFSSIGIATLINFPIRVNNRVIIVNLIFTFLAFIFLLPSSILFIKHWQDVENDAFEHYSPMVLAQITASSSLPENAILVQPKEDWNVNHLPYYTSKRHIARNGGLLYVFEHRGSYTPLKPESFKLLTTEKLVRLIESGSPIYAFEPNPLEGTNSDILDPSQFSWQAALNLDLSQAHIQIAVPNEMLENLPKGAYQLYLASLSSFEEILDEGSMSDENHFKLKIPFPPKDG